MKTTIDIQVDKELKEAAQEIAQDMGVTLGELINSYLIQVAVTKRVDLFAAVSQTSKEI